VSARQAADAGTFLAGVGLIALLAVYLHLFLSTRRIRCGAGSHGRRAARDTGLTSSPALFSCSSMPRLMSFVQPSVDCGTSTSTGFWAPQSPAACDRRLIACFTGFAASGMRDRAALHRAGGPCARDRRGRVIWVAFVFASSSRVLDRSTWKNGIANPPPYAWRSPATLSSYFLPSRNRDRAPAGPCCSSRCANSRWPRCSHGARSVL